MTMRQFLSIVLSCMLFGHVLSPGQVGVDSPTEQRCSKVASLAPFLLSPRVWFFLVLQMIAVSIVFGAIYWKFLSRRKQQLASGEDMGFHT